MGDRTALGEQTANAFKESRMESLQTFADIFEVKELKDTEFDPDTKVHIATVQGMVQRTLYPTEDAELLTADQYDCIVVDECHRGYLLDRELSDAELEFRDFNDYISKYRQMLDQFDAVKIGLTATPALHTTQIFGEPVYTYTYREAVIDGWLIDHEPPFQISTQLSEEGIVWNPGDVSAMKPVVVNPQISFTQLVEALGTVAEPDAVDGIVDQLLAKLRRKRRYLSQGDREQLEQLAGMPIQDVVASLRLREVGSIA
ncbi:MAG: DEAD/DEAH box helicase family protein [Leptolyngbyaceae cyanobacterium bins.302]|nr:DEAD/DEAH box helicase family protein [Leptolyngbyaceae cyanobacterium bins.302]